VTETVVWPAPTTTIAGGVAEVLLLVKRTGVPDGDAGPFSVSVAVVDLPPVTVVGLKVRDDTRAG